MFDSFCPNNFYSYFTRPIYFFVYVPFVVAAPLPLISPPGVRDISWLKILLEGTMITSPTSVEEARPSEAEVEESRTWLVFSRRLCQSSPLIRSSHCCLHSTYCCIQAHVTLGTLSFEFLCNREYGCYWSIWSWCEAAYQSMTWPRSVEYLLIFVLFSQLIHLWNIRIFIMLYRVGWGRGAIVRAETQDCSTTVLTDGAGEKDESGLWACCENRSRLYRSNCIHFCPSKEQEKSDRGLGAPRRWMWGSQEGDQGCICVGHLRPELVFSVSITKQFY